MKLLPYNWSLPLAWLFLSVLLALCLPLFLCLPPETDITFYDLCARNILRGGVHYRDAFDTNLPGMVWLHAAVRSTFGWSSEALRAVDFAIVAAIVGLLVRWLRLMQRPPAVRVWTAFALFTFYFSRSEWCHCQRDTWMLLPALLALELRRRQTARLPGMGGVLGPALLEGLCWGAAFWIKPFVMLPACLCWLVSVLQARRAPEVTGRRAVADAIGLLAGGLLAGGLGVAWLVATGAWPFFVDVFRNWNPEYFAFARSYLWNALQLRLFCTRFYPWLFIHLIALPVAILTMGRAVSAPRTSAEGGLLAAFYLGWVLQAVCLQNFFDYIHVPPLLLGLTMLAAWEPPAKRRLAATLLVACFAAIAILRHPLFERPRVQLWSQCLREGSTPAVRDRLTLMHATNWVELRRVRDYLAEQDLHDGELTCFESRTIALYLDLDVEPSTRLLYFDLAVRVFGRHRDELRHDLASSRQRYVVSDLLKVGLTPAQAVTVGRGGPLTLPPGFPDYLRNRYPWSEPIVFRAGRYLLHRATGSVGKFWNEERWRETPLD